MDAQALQAVSQIKGRVYQGSSLANGVLYHELPFDGFADARAHRGGTAARWDLIKSKSEVSFSGASVLDIGCSAGAFSIYAALAGAKDVLGMDHDGQAIEVAKCAATKMGVSARFQQVTIDLPFLKRMFGAYDIVIWLSQWMWCVKQYGIETAKDMLFEISGRAKNLIFESAADDAMAAIKGATQVDIGRWLWESTMYSSVKDIGFVPGWGNRHVFVCRAPISVWNGYTAKVVRTGRNKMTKVFRTGFQWMAEREARCMDMLSKYPGFPRLIKQANGVIEMSYCGNRENISGRTEQAHAILSALKEQGIAHRDINPKNILTLNGQIYLIDFGWSLFRDEKETPAVPPSALGGKYYANNKWNDEQAMKISLADGVYKK